MRKIIDRVGLTLFMGLALAAPSFAQAGDRHGYHVDPTRFYRGVWLEVARRPMWITDGCVVGTTSYAKGAQPHQVLVRDACRKGGPGGEETVLSGVGEIRDPGVNSRMDVQYNPLLSVQYNIIDHAQNYSWFIGTSPTLDNLFIYTRNRPTKHALDALVARARALGYDTSTLEFPWGWRKKLKM
jgi:apolipoprotein D and lipocalin family protein